MEAGAVSHVKIPEVAVGVISRLHSKCPGTGILSVMAWLHQPSVLFALVQPPEIGYPLVAVEVAAIVW